MNIERMNIMNGDAAERFPQQDVMGLDVFSADGQLVGRIAGYLERVPDDERALEDTAVDVTTRGGTLASVPRLLVDGRGYVTQAELAVPEDQVDVDLKGRRVTLRLTMAQIERIPHHEPTR